MSDLGDEWLLHLWWRDWCHQWGQIGLAVEEWERLYVPFCQAVC